MKIIVKIFILYLAQAMVCGRQWPYSPTTLKGVPCKIPFVHLGEVYHDCVPRGNQSFCYIDDKFRIMEICAKSNLLNSCELASPKISLAEVEEILSELNRYRASLPALRMRKLVWNSELAQKAQAAADKCSHIRFNENLCNAPTSKIGQSLSYISMVNKTNIFTPWRNVISSMFNEKRHYNKKMNRCYGNTHCDNFLNIGFDLASSVGCGKAFCEGEIDGKNYSNIYYCNFFPKKTEQLPVYIDGNGSKCYECYLLQPDKRFKCDKDRLCEACHVYSPGCVGLEDFKMMNKIEIPCPYNATTTYDIKVGICDAAKSGMSLPFDLMQYLLKRKP